MLYFLNNSSDLLSQIMDFFRFSVGNSRFSEKPLFFAHSDKENFATVWSCDLRLKYVRVWCVYFRV